MVVMDPSEEGRALQTYRGSTLDGYNVDRQSSMGSRASAGKSTLSPLIACDKDSKAARRDRAKTRRFRIMASLAIISAMATVALAVFTALNWYSSAPTKASNQEGH
ncbi:uncharacterized protein PG986_006766 [Apiospora aurea]|uniref:Uncharacterized protein n=1 Tax=Apiospora aurea TaxID=335848 RepID=A0ABR1QAM9_9PEZI